jgi:hypothetical protein
VKTYNLKVSVMAWENLPVIKEFEVRANSFTMAAGICKGQAAVNGWRVLEILSYTAEA